MAVQFGQQQHKSPQIHPDYPRMRHIYQYTTEKSYDCFRQNFETYNCDSLRSKSYWDITRRRGIPSWSFTPCAGVWRLCRNPNITGYRTSGKEPHCYASLIPQHSIHTPSLAGKGGAEGISFGFSTNAAFRVFVVDSNVTHGGRYATTLIGRSRSRLCTVGAIGMKRITVDCCKVNIFNYVYLSILRPRSALGEQGWPNRALKAVWVRKEKNCWYLPRKGYDLHRISIGFLCSWIRCSWGRGLIFQSCYFRSRSCCYQLW